MKGRQSICKDGRRLNVIAGLALGKRGIMKNKRTLNAVDKMQFAISTDISPKHGNYNGFYDIRSLSNKFSPDCFFFCPESDAIKLLNNSYGNVMYDHYLYEISSWLPKMHGMSIYDGGNSYFKQCWQMNSGDAGKYVRGRTNSLFQGEIYLGDDPEEFIRDLVDKRGFLMPTALAQSLNLFLSDLPFKMYEGWRCWMSNGSCVAVTSLDNERTGACKRVRMFAEEMDRYYSPECFYVMDIRDTDKGLKIEDYMPYSTAPWLKAKGEDIMDAVMRKYGK